MRDFLGTIGAQIEVATSFVPERQRVHDFYLMDIALSSGRFTARQLKQVNYCQLYLQVVTAADVVLPSGYLIDEWILAGVIHVNNNNNKIYFI